MRSLRWRATPCLLVAAACCRELGFRVVEVNASDTRSKSDAKASSGIAGEAQRGAVCGWFAGTAGERLRAGLACRVCC
jgi:hypothetical protein